MAEEVRELKEMVASLASKVGELSGLSKQVAELKEGMNLMREMLLRMDEGTSRKNKDKGDAGDSHTETETESSDGVEKKAAKLRRLELPVFEGDDPIGWFCRIERYFHINNIPEMEKLEEVVVCLENRALHWYQWKETKGSLKSWTKFKQKVLERFHTFQRGGEYKILFSNKQDGSVLEYVVEFERLSFPWKDASEECLMGAFLYGLKTEIQAELELAEVSDLEGLIKMAIRADGRNRILEKERANKTGKTTNLVGPKRYPTQPTFSRVSHYTEPSRWGPNSTYPTQNSRPERSPTKGNMEAPR